MHFSPLHRLARPLLLALAALLLVWLSLPRVLGLAAERWLAVPGLEVTRLDIAHIGGGQAQVRELRGRYLTAGGHRLGIVLHDAVLDYSAMRRHVELLEIARAEIVIQPGKTAQPAPWPQLAWPLLPLSEARIRDLQVTVQRPDRPPLAAQGSLSLQQDGDGRLLAEFRPSTGLLRWVATPGERVETRIEWLPTDGPPARATLQIARNPAQRPASLRLSAHLSSLAALGQALGVPLPLAEPSGEVHMHAELTPGEVGGEIAAAEGEIEFVQVSGRLGAGKSLAAALAGKARFGWQQGQPKRASVELQPGLNWQINLAGAQALQAAGRLEKMFAIHMGNGSAASDAALPFTVRSPRWGQWEGTLARVRIETGAELLELRQALAQVRFKGVLPNWQAGGLQANAVQAEGDIGVRWQPDAGLGGDGRLQIRAARVQMAGASPLLIEKPQWTVQLDAAMKSGGFSIDDLELRGEVTSKNLNLERGSEAPVTLGPTRLHIVRFHPASRRGEFALTADAVRLGDWPAPDLRSRIVMDGQKIQADGHLQMQQTPLLQFSAMHALDKACGTGRLDVDQDLSALGRSLQPRPPALRPLELQAGQADGNFDLAWCTQPKLALTARGNLRARGVTLGWEKARVEGVDLGLQLDALQPLQGHLKLAARGGRLATGTALADLEFDAALSAEALQLNAFGIKLLGGSVHAAAQRLPWPLAGDPVSLAIRDLDLGQLLALFKQPGLSGSGQLSGHLPLTYGDGGLEIQDGQLHSAGAGTLKYAPTLAIPENPGLQALRNLHFQKLGIQVWYAPGGAYRAQIKLDGNNPDFYNGYPVRFGLNIHGELPGLFRAALFSGDFNRHILEQLQSGKLQ